MTPNRMPKDAKIYVAGHRGLVGSAIVRALQKEGYANLLVKTRDELDLLDQKAVRAFFERERPEYVFLAAAKVGGIGANMDAPADFIGDNLLIETNIIRSAHEHHVKKLLFLGSSCVYPRLAPQPMKEEYLMTGPLEPTNQAYAVAKIAGIELCRSYNEQYGTDFISVMPTNVYGPGDHFDPETSHVIPSLMRKFRDAVKIRAKGITLWGTGGARREFLHVDDLASACVFLMNRYSGGEIVNIGTGEDITIKELAEKIMTVSGFQGTVTWDAGKPDGMPRKLLDVARLHGLGWTHAIPLDQGLAETYEWYETHAA